MKKLLLLCFATLGTLCTSAQFTTYRSLDQYKEADSTPAQTVSGYIPTENGWVKISLKVKVTSSSVMVVGYKEKNLSPYGGAFSTYGDSNPWRSCNAWAEPVSVYSDGREIANNFEYKAHVSGLGIVYF